MACLYRPRHGSFSEIRLSMTVFWLGWRTFDAERNLARGYLDPHFILQLRSLESLTGGKTLFLSVTLSSRKSCSFLAKIETSLLEIDGSSKPFRRNKLSADDSLKLIKTASCFILNLLLHAPHSVYL